MNDAYSDIAIALAYTRKAKDCKHEFTLTFAEYKRLWCAKRCYYTNTLLPVRGETWGDVQKWNRPTIDRVDNSKGYVTGNVVACSYSFNQLKAIWENPLNVVTPANIKSAMKKLENRK